MFDVSGPVDYKLFELSTPNRVVLDMRASELAAGFSTPAVKGLLKSVRAGKQGKSDARVVFDLAEGVRPKSFLLAPADKAGYRLVIDLYPPTTAPAPVKRVAATLPDKARNVVVAIDAGHGGEDPGCARRHRHAREGHHAGGGARAQAADRPHAGHDRGADARRRPLHSA